MSRGPRSRSGMAADHRIRQLRDGLLVPVPRPTPEPEQWPEGYHAADHLHPFDCTPADLDQEA